MLMVLRVLFFWGLVFCVGCGAKSYSTDITGDPPPHDGKILYSPNRSCMIEVVKKTGKSPIEGEISVYFYKVGKSLKDGYVPIEAQPTSATLLIGAKQKITLQPEGEALVTPSGPALFANRDVEGDLSFELDGTPTTIRLGER